jgi:hypothetical protein
MREGEKASSRDSTMMAKHMLKNPTKPLGKKPIL